MKITAWLRNALHTIRNFFIQIRSGTVALWQRIMDGVRLIWGLARKGFVELWQMLQPFLARVLRQGKTQTGLLIRKIGVKRQYRYNTDPNPLHQPLADIANALAIVIGLGAWPYQRAWFTQTFSGVLAVLAPHYWGLSALLCALPLIVVYLRWQSVRQQSNVVTWDILTLSTGLIGLFLALFAGMLMFAAFTASNVLLATMLCAIIAILAWLWGEGTNAYVILIRRPRPLLALLSLSKSLLFILSGWLILLYLFVVNFDLFGKSIQLESATFLFTLAYTAALIGAVLGLGGYALQRFNIRIPRFASTTS